MSNAKKYSKLKIAGDKEWQKYKKTGSEKRKLKAKDKYYQAEYIKEQAKQPVKHVNNIEVNVNSKNSTSKNQNILSKNNSIFKIFRLRRKTKNK